jgi:hypothetical protein
VGKVRRVLRAAGLTVVAVAVMVSAAGGPVQVGATLFAVGVVVVLATVLF